MTDTCDPLEPAIHYDPTLLTAGPSLLTRRSQSLLPASPLATHIQWLLNERGGNLIMDFSQPPGLIMDLIASHDHGLDHDWRK